MTKTNHTTALMKARYLPPVAGSEGAPEWIHLLPAVGDDVIDTNDDRGPYHVTDAARIIAASFADDTRLQIDENHSEDLAAPLGHPSPARGWITEMEVRTNGVWGKVEWTAHGAELVSSKAYRGISPVILHDKDKQVHSILRASLVNDPNFRGMASLHQKENEMDLRAQLIKMYGLPDDASDADIMKKAKAKTGDDKAPALQSAMGQVSVALGLAEDADPADIVTAVQSAQAAAQPDATKDGLITELQSSVAALSTQLTSLQTGLAASASEEFYQTALNEKRAGVGPASKDHLISLHQSDRAAAEAFVASMPKLDNAGVSVLPPEAKDGTIALNASQKAAAAAMGMSETDFTDHLKEIGD